MKRLYKSKIFLSGAPYRVADKKFILRPNPESLKREIKNSFEEIGETLAKDCSNNTNELWGHSLLIHNKTELDRMILSVKPFLFNSHGTDY